MSNILNALVVPLAFMFELMVSESIFLMKTQRRNHFLLRVIGSVAVLSILAVVSAYLFQGLIQNYAWRLVYFLLHFAYTGLAIYACFDMPWSHVLFVTVAGYSVEHIADAVVKIVLATTGFTLAGQMVNVFDVLLVFFLPYALNAALFYFLLVKTALLDETVPFNNRRVLTVSIINLLICVVLSGAMDLLELSVAATALGKVQAILGCVLCLILQVGMFQEGKRDRENRTLQQMMQMERNQHRISKETIELINMKCHDLKHQIDRLETMSDAKREKRIAELSHAILIYDSIVKTGCDALDMVLMEKKLLCEKYNIQFSYVVDGLALSGMDETDIYSLFGNMLDNAIESLQMVEDEEKRIMTLHIRPRMKMTYISMDNYYETPVVMRDGEIQTIKKQEPGMHGYGIKSISYIVNQYQGDISIQTENHHFTVEILLPRLVEA